MGFFGIGEKSGSSAKYGTMVQITDTGSQKLDKMQIYGKDYQVMSAMRTLQPCCNANEIAKQLGLGWSESKVFDILLRLKEMGYIEKAR
jgi:uncharacterized membrane protein